MTGAPSPDAATTAPECEARWPSPKLRRSGPRGAPRHRAQLSHGARSAAAERGPLPAGRGVEEFA